MREIWSIARRVCAVVTGIVFFVSGSLKLLDPVGAGLVTAEYFKFFHTGFLLPLSKAAGFFFALLETAAGAALITGIWRKAVAWTAMALTLFFTIMTLCLLIGNPQMDCGCFGEALKLTHAQSFGKNLILCALCAAAFFPIGTIGGPRKRKYLAFGLTMAAVLGLALYSLLYVPLVDFTPYRAGVELQSSLDNPAEASDGFVSTFIYEKNGREGSFTLDRLPDSTWTFVRTETYRRSVTSGDSGPVTLEVSDADGNYCEETLTEGEVMAVSVSDPSALGEKEWSRILAFVASAEEAGFRPLLLAASSPEAFSAIAGNLGEDTLGKTLYADRRTLLSLVRSNGGAVWFSEGMLVRKFAGRDLPEARDLRKFSKQDAPAAALNNMTRGRLRFQAYLLYTFAILFFL